MAIARSYDVWITSKTHGKIASNNRNISWQKKAQHESTNCIDKKSLTDHEPKRHRKYDGTHVNMASYITDSNWQKQNYEGM